MGLGRLGKGSRTNVARGQHSLTVFTMKSRPYLQLDVFADRAGAGNPLGVVFEADGLDGAAMQAIAAWTNLSETIFMLPPTVADADYRVRIFTPCQELPFAGHPSVGAAWAVLERGIVATDRTVFVQECAAGLLPVRVESRDGRRVTRVRAPRARRIEVAAAHDAALAVALRGMRQGALAPELWSNGPGFWLVELADGDAVRGLRPDLSAIAALTRATGAVGFAVHALEARDDHHLAVRVFCPADNIPEDPVTGSAQASIATRLAAVGRLPGADGRYVGSQGRELGRDGRVEIAVDGDGEVWIGGLSQAVIRGAIDW